MWQPYVQSESGNIAADQLFAAFRFTRASTSSNIVCFIYQFFLLI